MRGNLFENMVVSEALKHRFNQGQRSNFYFYRDSKGNEVDLVVVSGPDLFPIEIKAGMTIARDYFKGLNHIKKVFPERTSRGGGLVYGGADAQQRTDVSIVTYKGLDGLFELANVGT